MSELPFDNISQGNPDAMAEFLGAIWHSNSLMGDYLFICVRNKRGGWKEIDIRNDKQLYGAIHKYSPDCDLFFCPNPFSSPKRHRDNALPSALGWCDIDKGDL